MTWTVPLEQPGVLLKGTMLTAHGLWSLYLFFLCTGLDPEATPSLIWALELNS